MTRTIAACLRRFSLPAGMGLGEFQISGPLGVSAGCNAYSQSLLRTWVELRTTGK